VPGGGILVCGLLQGPCLYVELGTYFAGFCVCSVSFGVVGTVSMFNCILCGGNWVCEFVGVIAILGLGVLVGELGLDALLKKRSASTLPPLHAW
jgi:hypothetical protein